MAAMDLLGHRWALRILWELRDGGGLGARALRAHCDEMSSSVLYERLADLRTAGLVARRDDGKYALTPLGRQLGEAITPLQQWAQRWSKVQGRREP